MPRKLNLVVAACNNNGIGINGKLPWRLKKDMEFFKKITMHTDNPDKQNAVIMGRKTWFSIPEKFRPLKGRVNIILSRELKEAPDGVHLARSLPEAVSLIESDELSDRIENVHVIGGSSVYEEAMTGPYPCRIYLTRLLKDFECDTFLPGISDDNFTKIANPDNVPVELQEERDVKFRFEVYEKDDKSEGKGSVLVQEGPITCLDTSSCSSNGPIKCLDSSSCSSNGPIKFDIMAAMCHANRGIGYKMHLPWPSLKKDYVYFTGLVSTFKEKHLGARKIIHIRGRLTWTCCREPERCLPNVYHIIVSRTYSFSDFKHPRVLKVVPSFEDAVTAVNTLFRTDDIDSVWIMGGSSIYQASIDHPQCNLIYLTHVYTDFPADTFFPEFKDKFQEIHDHPERGIVYEDKGVKFEFKVYKKISSS